MTKATKITPLMKQYNDIKSKYPNTILLFRVGDFYETFGEDAILVSKVLGIVLTKRGAGSTSETELAGFPHHSIENYLPKLVKAGNTKNWVSEALNIMSKHIKINIQSSKCVWADVDNLVDLKSANKIIKNMESK